MTTSSPKSYNYLALRGAQVDDMEFIEQFGLDPSLAYTPKLNEAMLDQSMKENIDSGMDPDEAKQQRDLHARGIKKLLAQNGMLK